MDSKCHLFFSGGWPLALADIFCSLIIYAAQNANRLNSFKKQFEKCPVWAILAEEAVTFRCNSLFIYISIYLSLIIPIEWLNNRPRYFKFKKLCGDISPAKKSKRTIKQLIINTLIIGMLLYIDKSIRDCYYSNNLRWIYT